MNLQSAINSRASIRLAFSLGRALPPRAGYHLADIIAAWVAAWRNSAIVQAVRLNQSVVSQNRLNPGELDAAVLETFRHTARCLFDFYHYLDDPNFAQSRIEYNPRFERLMEASQSNSCGLVAAGLHMSNFDLIMLSSARRGGRFLVFPSLSQRVAINGRTSFAGAPEWSLPPPQSAPCVRPSAGSKKAAWW